MKLLITSPAFCTPLLREMIDYAKSLADEVVVNPYGRTMKFEEVKELWDGVDGIIAGVEVYSKEILSIAPKSLKVISRYGVGYEAIDVNTAKDLGIKVTNTPGVNADAVADLTFGLMLSIARKIPQYDANVRAGKWGRYAGCGLNGKTLGIIGMGAIGKKVAKRGLGFDMNILAYDPYFDEEYASKNGIGKSTIDEILEKSDFVTLHMPVTNETKKLINEDSLKKMKKTAYLINAARGPLIDEAALYNALKNKQIAGAALDVFETEPLYESPLFALDNIVVQPHLGGHTQEAEILMGKLALDNTVAVLRGEACRFVVNK